MLKVKCSIETITVGAPAVCRLVMSTCWQSVVSASLLELLHNNSDAPMPTYSPLDRTPITCMVLDTSEPSSIAVLTSAACRAAPNRILTASSSIETVPLPVLLLDSRPIITLASLAITVSSSTLLVPFQDTATRPRKGNGASASTFTFIVANSSAG